MARAGRIVWLKALLITGILIGLSHKIIALEVTLLDTTTEDSLDNWVRYSNQPPGRGWRESSYNSPQRTLRVHSSCLVDLPDVSNWLRTPYIARQGAHRLHVEIKFTIRKCSKHHDQERLQQCKESFKLLYYEAESDFANSAMPTWDERTYNHIDVIAADHVFTDRQDTVINTEIRSFVIERQGVYLAFYDQGACVTLISVRVFYYMCEAETISFVMYPNTTSGAGEADLDFHRVEGTCVPHAVIEKSPSRVCRGNGNWWDDLGPGSCQCMPGYKPYSDQRCDACPVGTYKWRTGSQMCLACPAHSQAPIEGSVECRCVAGYYRSASDDKGMPCSRPPSAPRNVTVVSVGQTSVNLTWLPPDDHGGRADVSYTIRCTRCEGSPSYQPRRVGLNITSVRILALNPDTQYHIEVLSENGVSPQSPAEPDSADVTFTTDAAIPSRVTSARVTSVGFNYVSVEWKPPPDQPGVRILAYQVQYYIYRKSPANATRVTTNKLNMTITNLQHSTEYAFQIRAKTVKGWGEFSHTLTGTTGSQNTGGGTHVDPQNTEIPVGIIVGSAVAALVCMVIVIAMVIIFLRRRSGSLRFTGVIAPCIDWNHRGCSEKNVSDCDTLQYSNVQCPHILDGTLVTNGGLTIPLFNPPGGVKTYIDPHTYEDPNQAVREFTKEIDASCITIESVIGGGEFGDVCKGRLRLCGKSDLCVAIKTLKAGASDKNRLDFLTEASIMGQFDDPNVIYLEGVVTKSNPIMIVTEYMENGSLDSFLRNNDGKFTVTQLVGMMRGIASGMRYLSDMGYVHRDLAARNILVNETLICKVADFGLSREMESDDTDGAYTTKGGKIPVRWTAPEAIAYRKFTSASDVWSYGVVMWEVMAYSERPYWNWSNQDVIKAVERGFRLPPPMDCPEAIYQLMLDCWQKERSHRPKFTAIVKTLDKLIRAPELLRKIAKPKPHQLLDPNVPDLTSYASIEEWLTSIKMDRYVEHFLATGYAHMEQVAQITLKDLVSMGITLVGHQKKIMNSVQTLRAQLYGAQMSDGFLV